MAVVTELVTKFNFQGSTEPLAEFNRGLSSAIKGLTAMTAAIGAATAVFGGFVANTLSSLDPLVHLSRTTGIAIESIQELGFAASVTGSSAEAMQGSLLRLNRTVGQAAQGIGRGKETFELLGISVKDASGKVKDASVIFQEIGDAARRLNLSSSEVQGLAERLGIDPSLVQLLRQSRDETNKLREKAQALGVITAKQGDQAAAFNDALTTLRFGMQAVRNLVAVGLAPQLTKLAEVITDLIIANREWIVGGIGRIVEIIDAVIGAIQRLAPVLAALGAVFVIAKVAAMGFGAVLAAIFSPAKLIAVAIVAVLAIIDDLIVAMTGGKSVIRDFFMEFFGVDIVPVIQNIIDVALVLKDAFLGVANVVIDVYAQIYKLISLVAGGVFDKAIKVVGTLGNAVGTATKGVGRLFRSGDDSSDEVGAKISPSATPRFASDTLPAATAINARGGENIVNNRAINQDVQITVVTSDPVAAADKVQDNLARYLNDADAQVNRGGR